MKYIEDIETYIFVINQNKNDIFEKYKELKTKPIELGSNLKLVKHKKDIERKIIIQQQMNIQMKKIILQV